MSTSSALHQPIAVSHPMLTARRVIALAFIFVVLTVAAFVVGRATAGSDTSTPSVVAIHHQAAVDLCRMGRPC